MHTVTKILVRASVLAACMASVLMTLGLAGCGQKGDLYLPSDDDFKQRATLPDIVRRQFPNMPPPKQPGNPDTPASTPSAPSAR